MKYNQKLREIIQNSQWSQDELAHRLGVSPRALSFWLNEKSEPSKSNQLKIDEFYNEIVGRAEISRQQLNETESKALATHIELKELLENQDLLDTTTLYLTYHTNTIEGSTMTLDDVRTVLDDENVVIPDRTAREQMEARNHRAAFFYILERLKTEGKDFRWTAALIKDIHLRLMNGILESAGQYRNYGVRILGSHTPLANYLSVPDKIDQLVSYMNATQTKNLIEQLAVTHAKFEQIHPFGDGNGRTGRLIMFAQALHASIVPPLIVKERKHAYYKYLELAQTREDYSLLRLFLAESILFTNNLLK